MSRSEDARLTWDEVDLFDIRYPEHVRALADIVEQAGRDAYLSDATSGIDVLPFAHWRGIAWDEPARRTRGKVYAGQLLSAYPTKFGDAYPLAPICKWWLTGYDKAHEACTSIIQSLEIAIQRRPERCCVGCGIPLRYKTRCEPCNRHWRNEKEKKRQADLRAAKRQENTTYA